MHKLTDTHCHLYVEQFDSDRREVVSSARGKGVHRILLPNIDMGYAQRLEEVANTSAVDLYPMTGLHPCSVNENYAAELANVKEVYESRKSRFKLHDLIAVGEIGIDFYWDKTYFKEQQEAFVQQCSWAKEWGLPIVIHVRDAFGEIFELMDELNDDNLRGVFHCFTGNEHHARQILDYGGFKLGIGGVVTFKNSGLDKTLKTVTPKDLVLETDSPYLAPAPHRGKRNTPEFLPIIAQKVADVFEVTYDEIVEISENNVKEVFGI